MPPKADKAAIAEKPDKAEKASTESARLSATRERDQAGMIGPFVDLGLFLGDPRVIGEMISGFFDNTAGGCITGCAQLSAL